jgi:hypothetical protein
MQQKENFCCNIYVVPVFFLRILWYSQSGDQPENNLAKIGSIPNMKVTKQDPSIFLTTYRNLS